MIKGGMIDSGRSDEIEDESSSVDDERPIIGGRSSSGDDRRQLINRG
jgi:hypothetical protein